jgi:hypothetical protein
MATRSFRCSNCNINWPLNVNQRCEQCGGEVWPNADEEPITYQEMLNMRDVTARRRGKKDAQEAKRLRNLARFNEFYVKWALKDLRSELDRWGASD